MNILFLISVHDNGVGGHFHSLNHISSKLSETNNIKIITIGPGYSKVLMTNPFFYKSINFKYLKFYFLKRELNKIIKEFKPDIYHFFDLRCYNIIRTILSSKKNKFVVTKCGGPNQNYDPHVDNLILFSLENYEWFKRRFKYRKTNIYLIPNRVKAIKPRKEFILNLKDENFTFVRICRIGISYKKSILDSFNLIKKIIDSGISNIKLIVIGSIENIKFYNELKNNELVINGFIQFYTDENYTKEASKMLLLADAVIGTGRGLMEAASLSIPLLTINSKGEIPVLINKNNFWDAFKTNFSERNIFDNLDDNENLKNIVKLIKNKYYYEEMSSFSKHLFDYYFNIDRVIFLYNKVYKNLTISSKRYLLLDSLSIIRSIINITRHHIIYKIKTKS